MPSSPPRTVAELAPDQRPTIRYECDGCVLAQWRRVGIAVWAVPSTLELVAEQEQWLSSLGTGQRRFSTAHLVVKRTPLPGAEVRASYEKLLRRHIDQLVCSGVLVQGSGFWASAVRAFMTGVSMLERRVPTKTFGDLDALAGWLAPLHNAENGETFSPGELRLVCEWLLAHPAIREHCAG